MDWLNKTHVGDCRDLMRRMVADGVKVQTCVSSPPYWQLRNYGVSGQIGLEPSIAEYVDTIVEVFRCVRDVLADDGVIWVNMGDGYASAGGAGWQGKNGQRAGRRHTQHTLHKAFPIADAAIKSKDLIGMPWMIAFALRQDGWFLRQDVIWEKPNPMPESVRDRCTKSHEYMFLLSKKETYYWDFAAMQEPASEGTHERLNQNLANQIGSMRANGGTRSDRPMKAVAGWATGEQSHSSMDHAMPSDQRKRKLAGNKSHKHVTAYEAGDEMQRTKAGLVDYAQRQRAAEGNVKNNDSFDDAMAVMPMTRNKRDVWTVASEPFSGAHFATFPTALIIPCILAGSRLGDTVLDPFMGSGTTAQVATNLGRNFIGCELNEKYVRLQRRRDMTIGLPLESNRDDHASEYGPKPSTGSLPV